MKLKQHLQILVLSLSMLPAALLLTGCQTTQPAVNYFVNADEVIQGQPLPDYTQRIRPNDELRIIISSTVPEATSMYNLPPYIQSSPGAQVASSERQLCTYLVTPSGYITLPVIGDVQVKGLTTEELKQTILNYVGQRVKDPIVTVEFTGITVEVLGQVSSPGRQTFSTQRISIFDVLARCGGVQLNGRKETVRLIREEDGRIYTHHLDLTDANIVNSPYFFLHQNDLIIVEPSENAKRNATYDQMNGYKLSVISTVVSACSVLASLIIALTH